MDIINSDIAHLRLKNGKTLYVESSGPTSSEAIIFMHGLGSNLDYWGACIDLANLKAKYRVIAYDWDGHGRSPLNEDNLSMESLSEDVISLMDTLEIEKATLVGHSVGGVRF